MPISDDPRFEEEADLAAAPGRRRGGGARGADGGRAAIDCAWGITVVVPFYNEAAYIEGTLESLANQVLPPSAILLVDNGSTDCSSELCRRFMAQRPEMNARIVRETRPGKIFALQTACSLISTEYVAFCDADTIYPETYFSRAQSLFDQSGADTVAVLALGVGSNPNSANGKLLRMKGGLAGRFLAKQCHAGGFGQIFRTSALKAAGGFDADRWPYILEDHEIIHRVLKQGQCRHDPDFWCQPSPRRKDRSNVSWSAFEQALYHLTPFSLKDWYFYRFLGPRLAARGLVSTKLRLKPWLRESRA